MADEEAPRPLQLHIRRLRQWYGDHGISKEQLATLANVPTRRLYDYETCKELPKAVDNIISIAFALNVPIETVFSPDYLDEKRADIEARRSELGLCNTIDHDVGFQCEEDGA